MLSPIIANRVIAVCQLGAAYLDCVSSCHVSLPRLLVSLPVSLTCQLWWSRLSVSLPVSLTCQHWRSHLPVSLAVSLTCQSTGLAYLSVYQSRLPVGLPVSLTCRSSGPAYMSGGPAYLAVSLTCQLWRPRLPISSGSLAYLPAPAVSQQQAA